MITRTLGADIWGMTWDTDNKLVTLTAWLTGTVQTWADYARDADGNLVRMDTLSDSTIYVGKYFEYSTGASVTTTYYSLGQRSVAMRQTSATTTTVIYLYGDHLGSVSLAVANGVKVGEARYAPFGEWRGGMMGSPLSTLRV